MSFKLQFNCPENWDKMPSCGTSRFCQNCTQNVHDLSQVDEEEAIELVQGPEKACVRFQTNKAGQVLTRSGFSKALIFSSTLTLGCWDQTNNTKPSTPTDTIETVETAMGEPEFHTQTEDCTDTKTEQTTDESCEEAQTLTKEEEGRSVPLHPPRMGKTTAHKNGNKGPQPE